MERILKKLIIAVSVMMLAIVCAVTASAQDHTHEYRTVITKLATCTDEGLEIERCDCGAEKNRTVVPARGHNSTTLKDNRCTFCSAYVIETGKTVDIKLEEDVIKYTSVAWSSTEKVRVEDYTSIPFLLHTAKIKGVKAGTATLYAFSKGEIIFSEKVIIECKNHSFTNYVSDNNAGCTDGTKTAVCDYCDKTNTIIDEGTAKHKYVYTSDNNATCESNSTKTGVCSLCGATVKVEEENTATGHKYDYFKPNHDATCEKDGTRTAVCLVCKKENTVVAEGTALGHNFINYIYNNDAECKKDGTKTATCVRCGKVDVVTVEGSATGHKYMFQPEVKPTCKKDGKTRGSYCGYCGEVFVAQEIIPATGEHEIKYSTSEASFDMHGTYIEFCHLCDDNYVIYDIPRVAVAKLEKTSYNYNGEVRTPKVYLEDSKGVALIEGSDFDVTYDEGRKMPGKYAVKVTLKGSYKGEKTLYFNIRTTATTKLTATQTTSSITLSWSAVTGADGYRIYVYDFDEKIYVTLKTVTKTSYTIKNLEDGKTYKYRVKSFVNVGSDRMWAEQTREITTSTKPETPTVKVKAGTKKAALSWNSVDGADGYQVYMKAPGESYKKLITTPKTSYTKTSLKSGKTYKFRVRAYRRVDGKNVFGAYKTYTVKIK